MLFQISGIRFIDNSLNVSLFELCMQYTTYMLLFVFKLSYSLLLSFNQSNITSIKLMDKLVLKKNPFLLISTTSNI